MEGNGPAQLRVVLYHPEIPQNTGNVARTCAATHTPLHLIEPLGFFLTDRRLKRAGLDYWSSIELTVHPNLPALKDQLPDHRLVYFSRNGAVNYYEFPFFPGDCLVFGSETSGLPRELLEAHFEQVLRIPIDHVCVRSLNLATTVGIALFEALRQLATRIGNRGTAQIREVIMDQRL
jgi:tRNA (cytidine/uridine-2'-O-)-methyltransferase